MNKWLLSFLLSTTVICCAHGYGLSLVDGYSRIDEATDSEITVEMLKMGAYGLEAYIQLPGDKFYYTMMGGVFGRLNLTEKKYLGSIPLTPWAYTDVIPEVKEAYATIGILAAPDRPVVNEQNPGAGCLNKTPLRYGTLDAETSDDPLLVLFLNNQMMFFSPKYKRVVFSAYYDGGDWLPKEKSDELRVRAQGYSFRIGADTQYFSMIYWGVDNGSTGYRAYSKLYTGDFDKNGNPDIIVWRKVYKSNKTNETAGFTLIRNELKHFERDLTAQKVTEAGITGEYLPQITTDVVIESWMRENKLTWSKGFPSLSECPGEEGKLIPEMHDPLLNDPDVLQ